MRKQMVLFLIMIAVIMAIAGFLLISFLTRGGNESPGAGTPVAGAPDGGESGIPAGRPYLVDNTTVYLNPVPGQEVRLVDELSPQLPQATASPIVQPTNPEPAQPQPTMIVPTPTFSVAPPVSGPNQCAEPVVRVAYVVQPGDTLFSISQKQKTSIELMAAHGIDAFDLIPGATLQLPVANPNCCPGSQTYVVRPGDTVFSLANRFNTTKEAIAQLNGLGPDYRINITSVLCIP